MPLIHWKDVNVWFVQDCHQIQPHQCTALLPGQFRERMKIESYSDREYTVLYLALLCEYSVYNYEPV